MDGGPRTVEEVFKDFKGRRAGVIKALTTDVESFYRLCDPEKDNLCLYGLPNETWEVNLPVEEVPPEIPEPALGINFARDGMQEKDWLSLVAVHSDSWLLAVAFYFGSRFNCGMSDRKRLFYMINELPTVFEILTGNAKHPHDVSENYNGTSRIKSSTKPHQPENHNKSVKASAPKDPVVLPHLVKPILDYLHLDSTMVDYEQIGRIFLPQDLHKLILHADLSWTTPPPSPEKPLRLTAPSPKKTSQDLPSTSGGSRPSLRSGDSLALIQQMADLNDKVLVLTYKVEEQTTQAAVMQSDIHRMVDLLTEMVEIFRAEEPAKVSEEEKKIEEVDPPAPKVVENVDLTSKSEEDDAKEVASDAEEGDSDSAEKNVSDEDRD